MAGVKDVDKGYKSLMKRLEQLTQKEVAVGVPAGIVVENGANLAVIAAVHEFGTVINMPARTQNIYRQTNKKGTGFNRNGRFVKLEQANFATQHKVKAYNIVIPERSFLRSTLIDDQVKIKKFAHNRAKEVVLNKSSAEDALNKLGHTVVGLVQKKIQNGNFVPNAPSTVRKKKSSRPLIDTGRLRQSITHKIRPKGQNS